MQALESGLLATPPSALGFGHGAGLGLALADTDGDGNEDDAEARVELENGVHQLETLLEATVDRNFDKFEIYALRNLFKVPDGLEGWMRLAHYEVGGRSPLPFVHGALPSSLPTTCGSRPC
jgi:kinetochore protein Mis12/MTW1